MKELTAKQKAIWDLQQSGKRVIDIASEMGISVPVVSKTLRVCRDKLGIDGRVSRGEMKSTEHRNPELAAAAIEAGAHPLGTLKDRIDEFNEHLKASGVPGKVSDALVRRLRVKYADAVTEFRELRTGEILEMLGKKLDMAAFYLDDKVMAEASARDIMLGMGVLIEKRNLLRGEPTAIVSHEERKKLNELLPMAIAEAQRRGLTVEKVVEGERVG